jgi:3-deoxy-D-manno-octulosonic-acid transferase
MYRLYRAFTFMASPFVPLVLTARRARGKEDAVRISERLGKASKPRPSGKLVWIHAASVGEANAVLPLIGALLAEHENLHVLLTTVTVTSAALLGGRLPERALHQFAPVDTPDAVRAFLGYWRPDIALFVDSEFWPNLMVGTRRAGAVMGLINARMSDRSFRRWRLARPFIRMLLSGFTLCFAQSAQDAERLGILGLPSVNGTGNLKYDAPALPCDEKELARLEKQVDSRPVWVAASTHPGEEAMIAQVHRKLAASGMRPLTIIVPRHAVRGDEVTAQLGSLKIARRSRGDAITRDTDIYLADTMGELGLFYRLASVAFIGGTLVSHGGQNPLEAAKLGRAIIAGPHMENFAGIMEVMEREHAVLRVKDAGGLARETARLLQDEKTRAALAQKAEAHVRAHAGMLATITQVLQPYLA